MSTATRSSAETVAKAVLGGRLRSIAEDMAATLANTARSPRISVRRQFACALLDPDCRVVAADNPRYLGSIQAAAQHCVEAFRFDLADDDVILTNDPYGGSPSVHYATLVAPLRLRHGTSAYLAVQAHMADLGGWVIGNYDPTARELRKEAVRFSPLKIVKFGRLRRDVFDTVLMNSRFPETLEGDLNGMLAAASTARRALAELVSKHGAPLVLDAMDEAIAYGRRLMLRALEQIPEGRYDGEAAFAIGDDRWCVRVALERDGGETRLDFSQTDAQAPIFLNCPPSVVRTQALMPLLGLVGEDPPWSAGLLEAVNVVVAEGTLVAPRHPAPTGWSLDHVGREVTEAVRESLATALPELVGPGLPSRCLAFVVEKERRVGQTEEQVAVTDLAALAQPGSGASQFVDGWGQPGPEAVGQLPSLEEFEQETELTLRELEYRMDSGGAGATRGGPGISAVIEFPADRAAYLYAIAGDGDAGPLGIAGGEAGSPTTITVADADEAPPEPCAGIVAGRPIRPGALLRIDASGGGGVGEPRGRAAERIVADVVSGHVSPEAASDVYGLPPDDVPTDFGRAAAVAEGEGARS